MPLDRGRTGPDNGAMRRGLLAVLACAAAVPHVPVAASAAVAVDLTTGSAVFERHTGLALVPASNEKLAVTYAALAALGPDYQIETDVLGQGELVGTTWRGPLVLQGHGDPTLSHLDLRVLARQVRAAGIRKVAGSVLGDESYFDSRRTAPGWKPSFYINESAPLSALTVDRTWFHDHHSRVPAAAAAALFKDALRAQGVAVTGRATRGTGSTPATGRRYADGSRGAPPRASRKRMKTHVLAPIVIACMAAAPAWAKPRAARLTALLPG